MTTKLSSLTESEIERTFAMMTQTHVLLPVALFARRGGRAVTAAAILGGLVPDSDVWIMFVVERGAGAQGDDGETEALSAREHSASAAKISEELR